MLCVFLLAASILQVLFLNFCLMTFDVLLIEKKKVKNRSKNSCFDRRIKIKKKNWETFLSIRLAI